MNGPARSAARTAALALVAGGVITIAIGIYLGATVEPLLYLIVAAGFVDFVVAWALASGRIGPPASARKLTAEQGHASALEAEPTYNPYARED